MNHNSRAAFLFFSSESKAPEESSNPSLVSKAAREGGKTRNGTPESFEFEIEDGQKLRVFVEGAAGETEDSTSLLASSLGCDRDRLVTALKKVALHLGTSNAAYDDGGSSDCPLWILRFETLGFSQSPDKSSAQHSFPPMVDRVVTHIERNLSAKITLSSAAKVAGASRQHFCRTFSNIVGMPFMQYVGKMRAQRALKLLENIDESIKEVAFAAGFGSIAQFNRVFKRWFSISPTEARHRIESRAGKPLFSALRRTNTESVGVKFR